MFAVVHENEKPTIEGEVDLWLQIGQNLRTGIDNFAQEFSNPTTLESDLLTLAAAIFASDVFEKRGNGEESTRRMRLSIPVVNLPVFKGQQIQLQRILNRLSDDNWKVEFVRASGTPEGMQEWPTAKGKTLLFSGGLDSLAASVDLIDELGADCVQLASHRTANPLTIAAQNNLHTYLEDHYKAEVHHVVVRTGGKNTDELEFTHDPEVSQRTRSFTFLTIAALAARRRGQSEIVMIAENGQMAIHVPLSGARIGAFSTHTAHPQFVSMAQAFFTEVLQFPIVIENPYLYQTKAEVIAKLAAQHKSILCKSMSCWKSARAGGHCGSCVPCYVRRIALETHDVKVDKWNDDMFNLDVDALPSSHIGKRNLGDLAQFVLDFRTLSDAELDIPYIELNNTFFERNNAIAMYRRFANEAYAVMSQYPKLSRYLT